jgi:RNA polymerase sigma-70 factor (ECF subfamily)
MVVRAFRLGRKAAHAVAKTVNARDVLPPSSRNHRRNSSRQISDDLKPEQASNMSMQAGDAYELLRPQVARVARNLLRASPPSELVHDVCVDVALSLARYRGQCALPSWVYAVVSRRVYRWIRKENRYRDLMHQVQDVWKPRQLCWPDEVSAAVRYFDQIRDALTALPERERTCLMLVHFESLPAREVARRLSISPDAVRMNIHRARVHMRKALAELCIPND